MKQDNPTEEPKYPTEEKRVDSTEPTSNQQITPQEQRINEQLYDAEQRQNYCERQVQRFERMSKYSLDKDNQRIYRARKSEWKEKLAQIKESIQNFKRSVANSAESGIIGLREVNPMSIHSIDMPIEQRNTGKGNPNAVLMFGVELNNRQKMLLEKLPEFDSRIIVSRSSVNMTDLAALTAYTGDEFAMFTKGNERLIIRGGKTNVNIDTAQAKVLANEGYRWSGHTHPGLNYNCLTASLGDKTVLKCFPQKTSVIYNSKGQYLTFSKEE